MYFVRKAIGGLFVSLLIVTTVMLFSTGCGSSGGSSTSSDSTPGGTDTGQPNENGSSQESGTNRTSHQIGKDCVSCHATQESDKRYVYAGTVYASSAGTSTKAGAVVVITESSGTKLNITTDQSGNFYTTRGTRGATYNATIQGNMAGMVSTAANGGCASCHDGAIFPRIYIN